MVVEDEIIVEIKAIEKLLPIHDAQLLSYLRLTKKRVGLLMNFHVPVLKYGLKRIVNEFPDARVGEKTSGPTKIKSRVKVFSAHSASRR